ncbi:spore germination protein KC [Paenibacillus sp. UNC496MF]|uniref:Ger(x)C family spore germination protein n=1 Tax=Paenibacillus sp. UNC496MF TaxID=1502753 RepID=UPI0008ECB18B|nr:Ger(x)C family spore germination protein [Paenibacillus sp. UNC496MF]SFJ92838.1 spore germination protein KC [Paenibacillus sp. UNC496MF]
MVPIARALGIGLLLVVLACATCGCWSSVELNERAFARVMMLDKSAKGIELTLGFPLTNRLVGGNSGGASSSTTGPPFAFVTKSSHDVGEAFQLIQADLSRRITFGQLRNIVISRAFAQEGIYPIADFLMRDTGVHINANLFVADGSAKLLGTIPLTFERFLTEILTSYSKQKATVIVSAKDMLMNTVEGGDFMMPMLIFGNGGAEMVRNGQHWMGTDGAGIFRQGKLVAKMSPRETKAAMWILDEIGRNIMRVPSPSDGKIITFILFGNESDVKPALNHGHIRFNISCSGSAQIIASESTLDVTDKANVKILEKRLDQELKNRILATVSHTQQQRADVFGFGQLIRWRQPKTWNKVKNDWRNVYQKQVTVDANVKMRIKWIGGAEKPAWNLKLAEDEVGK